MMLCPIVVLHFMLAFDFALQSTGKSAHQFLYGEVVPLPVDPLLGNPRFHVAAEEVATCVVEWAALAGRVIQRAGERQAAYVYHQHEDVHAQEGPPHQSPSSSSSSSSGGTWHHELAPRCGASHPSFTSMAIHIYYRGYGPEEDTQLGQTDLTYDPSRPSTPIYPDHRLEED